MKKGNLDLNETLADEKQAMLGDVLLSKEQAIEAMKSGTKLIHRLFDSNKWITMESNLTIVTEASYVLSTKEFWGWRTSKDWENGWSIWCRP